MPISAQDNEAKEQIKKNILNELPGLIETDLNFRNSVLRIASTRFADRNQTEDRFEKLLNELRQDREKQDQKWEAQERKWAENQKVINEMLLDIKKLSRKHDSTIGAIGARWGLNSEKAFRNGLQAILEESFPVKVTRYLDFDTEGRVFGRPDQVELDLVIFNNTLIIVEIKSSCSKSDIFIFLRKIAFYKEKHQAQPKRVMVISPMVDNKARDFAKDMDVELYSSPDDPDLAF